MKSFTALNVIALAGSAAAAWSEADYDSGLVHEQIMMTKFVRNVYIFLYIS